MFEAFHVDSCWYLAKIGPNNLRCILWKCSDKESAETGAKNWNKARFTVPSENNETWGYGGVDY